LILFLVRHGNTFERDQQPYWIGSQQDLDLTSEGINQAFELAKALSSLAPQISEVVSAPLLRTLKFSSILQSELKIPGIVREDLKLAEINYGDWGGLTSAEILERFGSEEIEDWEKRGIWPKMRNWSPSSEKIKSDIFDLTAEIKRSERNVLLVSSNGILRYFLHLIPGLFERALHEGWAKMRTGALGVIRIDNTQNELLGWNLKSSEIDCSKFIL